MPPPAESIARRLAGFVESVAAGVPPFVTGKTLHWRRATIRAVVGSQAFREAYERARETRPSAPPLAAIDDAVRPAPKPTPTPKAAPQKLERRPSPGKRAETFPTEPGAIGAVRSYPEFRAVLAARRRDLGLSQLEVDHLAGLQDGYTGKIECGVRCLGDMSLQAILGALRISLTVRDDEQPRPAVPQDLIDRAAALSLAAENIAQAAFEWTDIAFELRGGRK